MTEAPAAIERSDVCAVPAAAVVGEAMVALVLADALLEKFGGDTMAEIERGLAALHARSLAASRSTAEAPLMLRRSCGTARRACSSRPQPVDRPSTPTLDALIET